MTRRVTLPGDEWAEVKEPKDLTNRERKALRLSLMQAMTAASGLLELGIEENDPKTWAPLKRLSPDEADPFEAYQRKVVHVGLVRWSLDDEIPATEDAVDDLHTPIYDALVKDLTGVTEKPDFSPDGVTDPKADTSSSNGSKPPVVEPSETEPSSTST